MKSGAPLLMVNDNVRYVGASISVDLILSSIAEQLGFMLETILVLPNGKGNSSQQMGEHGRDSPRNGLEMRGHCPLSLVHFPLDAERNFSPPRVGLPTGVP